MPDITYFKPAGIPLRDLEEVRLSVEEVEALRLKELEGLDQAQGAEKMNISRPTFQRVLASAREKTADALLNGKAIRIEGGNFEVTSFSCKCISGFDNISQINKNQKGRYGQKNQATLFKFFKNNIISRAEIISDGHKKDTLGNNKNYTDSYKLLEPHSSRTD